MNLTSPPSQVFGLTDAEGYIVVSGDIRFRYEVRPIDQDIKEQSERPCRLVKANQWSLYH